MFGTVAIGQGQTPTGQILLWVFLLIVLIERALITPPVGLNLYVVQGARKEGRLSDVMVGAIPFVFVMLVMVGLLIAFPSIALLFAPA